MSCSFRRTIPALVALVLVPLALLTRFVATAAADPETVVAVDDFDRADETPFAIGGNWGRVIAGNYDGHSLLVGSQVRSASNEGIYYWQGAGTFSPTRQFARERVVQKDGEVGLVLLGGADQAIMVGWGPPGVGSTVYIYWYSAGLDRGQLATGPSSLVNGDIVEAVLDGGRIYAKVNGATVLSVANTTTLTTGNPGFITYLDTGQPSLVAIFDDWQAGTPASYAISGTIIENSAGLSGVLVSASGGASGSTTTDVNGAYTLAVSPGATSVVITPFLSGHTMSPLTRSVAGPVNADVAGQDFTSTAGGPPPPNGTASDDFDRANESPLTVGGDWTQPFGGGSAALTSQHVVGVSADALYYWQGAGTFDNARQYARLRVVSPAGQVGLVLLGSPGKAFVVSWHAGTLFFYWYTGGSYQGNLTTTPSTLQAGDLIEASLDGGVVRAKINGSVVASVTNTTSLNAGRPGFETFQSGAELDDWEAGTPEGNEISGTITENSVGLSGVTVTASGGFSGSASTNANGDYTIAGVPDNATAILLTPFAPGHEMSPLTRTVAGPVTGDVTGQDFTSTAAALPPGAIAFDDFNRANETPLTVGGNWVQPFGGTSAALTSQHVAGVNGDALYYWQGAGTFDDTRQYARAHVLSAAGQVGIVLLGGPGQALVTAWGGGRLYVYWYLSGSHHGELVNEPFVLHDGDVIEAELAGGVVRAKVNGVVIRSVGNTTSLTSGRPGFETWLSGGALDDWEAGTPQTYEVSGTITEYSAGLSGVTVTASGGASGVATTDGGGHYTIANVAAGATAIVVTPSLAGHAMSPTTRTVAGPVSANVAGLDFTSTPALPDPDVVARDDFNRANETPLTVGGNWTQPFAAGSVQLAADHVVSAGGEALYSWQGSGTFHATRQFSRLRVLQASGQVGLVLLGSPGNALVVSWNAGTLYVYWYNGGSYQGNLTTMSSTLQNGDLIEASLEGGLVRAKINGATVLTVANTTSLTSGRPGFETFQTGAAFDDWEAGPPPDDRIAAVPAPGSAISTGTPCVAVPVVFTRTDTTPLRAYSVTVELSPNLSLCGAQIVSADYPLAPRQLLVTPLSGNRWTVDEVTLGTPCGATGSGTLFTLSVTSASTTGSGTIAVSSLQARDCLNHVIPAFPGAVASVTIDREGPAATLDLTATQITSGNSVPLPDPPHGTTPLRLDFTMPPGAVSAEVYRRSFGGYPQYDENGGAEPAAPSVLPGGGWTLTGVTSSGQTDEPTNRDFWYYALVTYDAHGNPSAVSNRTPGNANYSLGDVSTGLATCAGDDRVNSADLSFLGSHYAVTVPVNDPLECLDIGPTTDGLTSGRPQTDNEIGFEDLIMMAFNFGEVSAPGVRPGAGEAAASPGGVDRIELDAPARVARGESFDVRVSLHAGGALHALSVALACDRGVAEPIGVRSGEVFERAGGAAFAAGAARLDAVLLGGERAGLNADGAFAVVSFRALADGEPAIRFESVLGRDGRNRPLRVEAAGVPAPSGSTANATRLYAAAPSPFTGGTALRFTLAAEGPVELDVFGIDGRRVRGLVRGPRAAGEHRMIWDGTDQRGRAVAPGVYVLRLVANGQRFTKLVTRLAR